MKKALLFSLIILISCTKEQRSSEIECSENYCDILNAFTFSAYPDDRSIVLRFGQTFVVDFGKVCLPDALEFYISEDNVEFEKIASVDPFSETFVIDNLENHREYYIKMVNFHCQLEPILSPTKSLIVGEIPLPEFINNAGNGYKDIRLAPDANTFIYRTNADEWWLSTLEDPATRNKIIDGSFPAKWDPHSELKITHAEDSRILKSLDINSNLEFTLYNMEESLDSSQKIRSWIGEFHHSLDGNSIYFMSNKETAELDTSSLQKFENIWKLDLASGSVLPLSNFQMDVFNLSDFIEDPNNFGNFYVLGSFSLGGEGGEEPRYSDIYYYNTINNSLVPIYESKNEKAHIDINPAGDQLIYTSNRTGSKEIWIFSLVEGDLRQITNSFFYFPTFRWHYLNWISDNSFMAYVRTPGGHSFAIFSLY